jgi:hypothetical protein
MVGGPSIVFNRLQIGHETFIREAEYKDDAKMCRKIIGFDANSLYNSNLLMAQCTGFFLVRKAPEFIAEQSQVYGRMAAECLDYIAYRDGVKIMHKFNQGYEFRITTKNLPVDGMDFEHQVAYQFDGCRYHGCLRCTLNKSMTAEEKSERRQHTKDIADYIKSCKYKYVTITECEWLAMKKKPEVVAFLKDRHPELNFENQRKMTQDEILKYVMEDKIFGFLEVDIHTPPELEVKFEDFPPIFKKAFVSRDDIGPYMRTFAEERGLLKQPSCLLISSYFAKKQVFLTPLIKFYIQQGLKVTKYTV